MTWSSVSSLMPSINPASMVTRHQLSAMNASSTVQLDVQQTFTFPSMGTWEASPTHRESSVRKGFV